jgi:hypothetical protein
MGPFEIQAVLIDAFEVVSRQAVAPVVKSDWPAELGTRKRASSFQFLSYPVP